MQRNSASSRLTAESLAAPLSSASVHGGDRDRKGSSQARTVTLDPRSSGHRSLRSRARAEQKIFRERRAAAPRQASAAASSRRARASPAPAPAPFASGPVSKITTSSVNTESIVTDDPESSWSPP